MRLDKLRLPPLHCSLEAALGDYYQDFSPILKLIESGYHGGLDSDGVPVVHHKMCGMHYSAVTTAQYALANITAIRRGDDSRTERAHTLVEWLVSAQERSGELAGCWATTYDNSKYPWLVAPWTSALASGNAMSALLRGWELFGDIRYRLAAGRAYDALHIPRTTMRLCEQTPEELWYEEYPAEPPLRVLNGHVYALLGVADWARCSGDPEADRRWRSAAATLLTHLGSFDLGYWSVYDLRFREPVSRHYQRNIHIPQLRVLAALTGEPEFGRVADRWERRVDRLPSAARLAIATRVHAWTRSSR